MSVGDPRDGFCLTECLANRSLFVVKIESLGKVRMFNATDSNIAMIFGVLNLLHYELAVEGVVANVFEVGRYEVTWESAHFTIDGL